ncbi:MAG TPA: hypothetical protein VKA67_06140, partial [Verrucomicrobiae bacterium]|nr:hypothetical protein [Verrucomicrobiae bacterium]
MKPTRSLLTCLGVLLFLTCAKAGPTNSLSQVTAEKMQACFQCNGTGMMNCPTCHGTGWVACPGPCLKLSHGNRHHMNVAGHPPTDLWITFHNANHTTTSWNQNHVGNLIELRNGQWTDVGRCPICGGTGKVKCRACDGTGEVKCTIC